jgi:hypothetical protein
MYFSGSLKMYNLRRITSLPIAKQTVQKMKKKREAYLK